jgi:hypothetical protein
LLGPRLPALLRAEPEEGFTLAKWLPPVDIEEDDEVIRVYTSAQVTLGFGQQQKVHPPCGGDGGRLVFDRDGVRSALPLQFVPIQQPLY